MKKLLLSQGFEALIDDEDFDRVSRFRWHVNGNRNYRYATRMVGKNPQKSLSLANFILKSVSSRRCIVYYKNSNTLDCQKENLTLAERSKAHTRSKKTSKLCSSVFKGVSWSSKCKKWHVFLQHNRKRIWLGQYDRELDAAKAYNTAALKYHGEEAFQNIIVEERA